MLFILIMTDWGSNPRALSKALGALCNPRWPAAHGRSSPTTGTTSSQASYRLRRLFMLCIKSHLALTPLLLLSESNPLRWALIRFLCPQNWLTLTRINSIALWASIRYITSPNYPTHQNKQRPHLGTLLVQSVKEHSVKLSRNSKIYVAVEKTGKKAEKVRAIPVPCC